MRRPGPGRALSSLLLLVVAAAPVLLTAGPARAHTSLVSSSPAAGSVVADLGVVTLVFSQAVSPRQVRVVVTGPAGADLAEGSAQVSGGTVRQPVGALTESGDHRLAYRVLAADGHPITGEVPFQVELAATSTSTAGPSSVGTPVGGPATGDTAPDDTAPDDTAPGDTTPGGTTTGGSSAASEPRGATQAAGGGWAPGVALGLAGASVALVAGAVRAGRRDTDG